MNDCFQYETFTGSQTFNAALNRVFGPTPYNFVVVDSFMSESFENFGRDNCLSLFQNVLQRYGAEFTVQSKTVTIKREIGVKTDFQFRWGVNLKGMDKQEDTNNFSTYIEGFGGEEREDGTFPVHEKYTSPNAEIFGIRHADAEYDERRTVPSNMQAYLKRTLIDQPQLSVTVSLAEVTATGYTEGRPTEGDWGFIVYEPMGNFQAEARIAEINEVLDANLDPIDTSVTLSSIRRRMTDTVTRFANTSKKVDRLLNGQGKLPYNVLDDAIKIATEALHSAMTEVVFDNELHLIEKTNSNHRVILNSGGVFLFSRWWSDTCNCYDSCRYRG
ncbi:phage tail protein [Alkalicoccobacillus murimartini]|uniref:Tail spike domain-containing protein n=1 Tax=Alkalicoccobacillus murimartini TaxID=171685 RepID=A0ABT9YLZ1_9BACI|nr:phage tail protein [Alkalicoccobacillus murimartini]MDQ0208877.1 hypothetical protein [Alkalicoccobacillus murimartini]